MPNMDDIAFFDTEPYEHRGGIWSDAGRRPRAPTPPQDTQTSATFPPVTETTNSTNSNDPSASPETDGYSVHSAPSSFQLEPPDMATQRESQSSLSGDASKTTRRRTWFSSIAKDDEGVNSAPAILSGSPEATTGLEEQRGRPLESGTSPTSRSRSGERSISSHPSEKTTKPLETMLHITPMGSTRRSVSQHSMQAASEGEDSDASSPRPKSSPNTPQKTPDSSLPARPSSPPSFLSTLKSKAGDKQALGNTAKEAMLKWGVKWGGFRKDSAGHPQQSSEGSTGSGLRAKSLQAAGCDNPSDNKGSAPKPRASYADVRAAVAERLGQRASLFSPSTESFTDDLGPNDTAGSSQHSSTNSETLGNDASTAALLLAPMQMTSKRSFPSIGPFATEDLALGQEPNAPAAAPIKHAPIHMQPVAKTMSIPGIHVSHRGDVQAMGHVAPQAPPPPPTSAGPVSEAMLKKIPDLQKVYRLLKANSQEGTGPLLDTQESSHLHDPAEIQSSILGADTELGAAVDHNPAAIVPTQASVASASPRPLPPPLPPRANSTQALANHDLYSDVTSPHSGVSEVLRNMSNQDDRNCSQAPGVDQNLSSRPSTAQDKKDIGSVDLPKTSARLVSMPRDLPVVNGAPPPLPPRRAQASLAS